MANPQEVIDSAKQGDTVRVTLRGPASASELLEMKDQYEETYPGVNFVLVDNGLTSDAEIVDEVEASG